MADKDQQFSFEVKTESEVPSEVVSVEVTPSGMSFSEAVPQAHTGQITSNFFNEEDDWVATEIRATPNGEPVQITKPKDSV